MNVKNNIKNTEIVLDITAILKFGENISIVKFCNDSLITNNEIINKIEEGSHTK